MPWLPLPLAHPKAAHLLAGLQPPHLLTHQPPAPLVPSPGFHRAFTRWLKPFNPILGETWQAAEPDGSQIFLEQISHHPPISAFQLLGPRGLYTFCGQRCALCPPACLPVVGLASAGGMLQQG